MASPPLDMLIVGGGINGTGIARDAAGRGLSVALVEQDDLAQHTSSRSTKLIHGGLRYLEYYEFRLVREALQERERLLAIAPHIIWPLRFVLPHESSLRPGWMIRAGLVLYDHLGGRSRLPRSRGLRLRRSEAGAPLKAGFTRGFVYSDCWVEDSRLVALNAADAAARGASIMTRTRLVEARRAEGLWRAEIEGPRGAETLEARVLVNAAGPWVDAVMHGALGRSGADAVRLVKGSHIVVRRLYAGEHAYILQNPDRRIVFAIPYEGEFTLIGTTEEPWEADPATVAIDGEETRYLCETINRHFQAQIAPADVVWSYSGVRPLYDDAAADASAVTRDYVLKLDSEADGCAALLAVYGGKITTYRRLAEHALEKLAPHLRREGLPRLEAPWTAGAPLPGGDIEFDRYLTVFRARHPWLAQGVGRRLVRAYGSRAETVVAGARAWAGLGEDFGGGLTEAEAAYLVRHEWARTAEDILWRRSKLGLHVPPETEGRLQAWLNRHRATLAPA